MDDHLSRRLAALRHSLELRAVPPIAGKALAYERDALAIRFEQIFNKSSSPKVDMGFSAKRTSERSYEGELSIEELINTLSSGKETWVIDQIDGSEIEPLRADSILPIPLKHTKTESRNGSAEVVPDCLGNGTSEDVYHDMDAQGDILRMIRDEIEFEAAHGIVSDGGEEEKSQWSDKGRSLTPSKTEFDEDLLKRFEALGGLELPPVPRIELGVEQRLMSSPTTPELDESETWCCICNEDAEYRCSGCENDIYCASCLYEGHTGPNAKYEERKHRWTKSIKPKRLTTC